MKKVTLEFNVRDGQPVLLPQAELLKGVTGSVLIVQINDKQYQIDMAQVVGALLQEVTNEEAK